jgi:predicted dehydrogenase
MGPEPLRVAVIGAGAIAREHLRILSELDSATPVGVCDLSPALAEAMAEQFSLRPYHDHRRLLEELRPDVVHVATPPRSHVPLALDALEAGAHVFVEKPIALDAADLAKLRSAAEARERHLIEDHNYLFNGPVQRILALLRAGELGEVVHVEASLCVDILGRDSRHADRAAAHPFADLPGGPLADFVTHLAYLACAFVGPHRSVSTLWRQRGGVASVPFDDLRALVDAERGTALLSFSSHAKPEGFTLRVHGTRLRATASLFEPFLGLERLHGGPRPLLPVRNGLALARAHVGAAVGGLWRKLAGRPSAYEGLGTLLARVYAALARGAAPPVGWAEIEASSRLVWDLLAGEPRR